MPKHLDRLKKSLMEKQNIQEWPAIALATSILDKNWYMKDWKLTARWKLKQRLKEWVHWIPKK
jgi:hypothetical protein